MQGTIYGLVGSSGAGKTYLWDIIVSRMPNVKIIRSTTTRASRGSEEEKHYIFISPEEFARRSAAGEFVPNSEMEYAGNQYGYERAELDGVLQNTNGIFAIIEPVVEKIRKAGYDIKTIHVVPEGKSGRVISEERKEADTERARYGLRFDLELVNSFEDRGKAAIQTLSEFIKRTAKIQD